MCFSVQNVIRAVACTCENLAHYGYGMEFCRKLDTQEKIIQMEPETNFPTQMANRPM